MSSTLEESRTAGEQSSGAERALVLPSLAAALRSVALPLGVLGAISLVGWFLTEAGATGRPTGALRTGAVLWLTGHGSTATIDGALVSIIPLGLTLFIAWSVWRYARRLGEQLAGYGPDAGRLADGERDLVVPLATALFTGSYTVLAVAVATLAGTPESAPNSGRVLGFSLLLGVAVATPAVAVGSGRAAIWSATMPEAVTHALVTARRVLLWWLTACTLVFVVALAADLSTAANVVTQLDLGGSQVLLLVLATFLVVPNAVIYAGSYVLSPGFVVGTGTAVAPAGTVLGPLPAIPLFAALPGSGPTPGWVVAACVVAPMTVAAAAAFATGRRHPTLAWEQGALRGGGGGAIAGLAFGALAALSGGAAGPGRMAEFGPDAAQVAFHAAAQLGFGGLLGGLAIVAWQRRTAARAGD